MSRYPRLCPRKYEEWFKEGRGSGTGAEYQPFVTVHDFPSRGRVHRIFGIKTRRVHHLLSDLERNVFLGFEWPDSVTDVREQYPLRLEKTLKIAEDLGIPHPLIRGSRDPFIMTTDLLLTRKVGLDVTYHPRTVKYASDLRDPKAAARFLIERRYWAEEGFELKAVTEQHVSITTVENLLWVRPYHYLISLYPLTATEVNEIARALTRLVLRRERPLWESASACDRVLGLPEGTSLAVVRHLLATRYWRVRMNAPLDTAEPLELLNEPTSPVYSEFGLGRLAA